MRNKVIIIIIAIVIIISLLIIIITINRRNVKMEYLGEIKIAPQQTEPSASAEIKLYHIWTETLIEEYVTDEPFISFIYNKKDKEIIEKTYNIEIDFEEDYDNGKIIFCIGSRVERMEITGRHYDELSDFKDPIYLAKPTFEDDYDGNIIYFYRVNRTHFFIRTDE